MIVVDASCILELLLRSPRSGTRCEKIEARLLSHDGALCAPHLIDVEVSHSLRRYSLSGELSAKRGREALTDLADFPLERFSHVELLPRMWQLRDNFTAYDAAYLALAEALRAPLMTRDKRLATGRGHHVTIEVF